MRTCEPKLGMSWSLEEEVQDRGARKADSGCLVLMANINLLNSLVSWTALLQGLERKALWLNVIS